VIDLFSSSDVALDDRHGPKLYARFLKGLLNASLTTSAGSRHETRQSSIVTEDDIHSSPLAGTNSLSPPPSKASMSFDQFAPAGGVVDPFVSPAHPDLAAVSFSLGSEMPQENGPEPASSFWSNGVTEGTVLGTLLLI
jgi:hypothetical protein